MGYNSYLYFTESYDKLTLIQKMIVKRLQENDIMSVWS